LQILLTNYRIIYTKTQPNSSLQQAAIDAHRHQKQQMAAVLIQRFKKCTTSLIHEYVRRI